MQHVLLPRLGSLNIGLHIVLGEGNLRTGKLAVIFEFWGYFWGYRENSQKVIEYDIE